MTARPQSSTTSPNAVQTRAACYQVTTGRSKTIAASARSSRPAAALPPRASKPAAHRAAGALASARRSTPKRTAGAGSATAAHATSARPVRRRGTIGVPSARCCSLRSATSPSSASHAPSSGASPFGHCSGSDWACARESISLLSPSPPIAARTAAGAPRHRRCPRGKTAPAARGGCTRGRARGSRTRGTHTRRRAAA